MAGGQQVLTKNGGEGGFGMFFAASLKIRIICESQYYISILAFTKDWCTFEMVTSDIEIISYLKLFRAFLVLGRRDPWLVEIMLLWAKYKDVIT